MSSAIASSWFGGGSSSKTKNANSESSLSSKAKTAMPGGNAALEKKCKAKKNQSTNQCKNFVAAQKKKKTDDALKKQCKNPKFKKANAKKCQHVSGSLGKLNPIEKGKTATAKNQNKKKGSMLGNMMPGAKKKPANLWMMMQAWTMMQLTKCQTTV